MGMNKENKEQLVTRLRSLTVKQLQRELVTKKKRLTDSVNQTTILAEQVGMLQKEIDKRNAR